MKRIKKQSKGITIISLAITIVVMIILASITITVVVNTGLFEHASNAKRRVEIANEEKNIKLAAIQILENDKIDKENLLEKLKSKFGEGNVKTYNNGDGSVIVELTDKNIAYEVDEKGNIKEVSMDIFNVDSTPGVLDGKGTTSDPYIIMSIEDLVEMSKGTIKFDKKYVKLGRNLDFKSELSYENYETKEYNGFLGITDDVGLMEALTDEKYNGFTPITFSGNPGTTFDGDNKVIKNIYMKGTGTLGFLKMNYATLVKNLEITGKIVSTGDYVGGISAQNGIIENCISRIDIISTGKNIGGIVSTSGEVSNCKNYGKITGASRVGGIAGYKTNIYNSENYGSICAEANAGGITGGAQQCTVQGCKNFDNVSGNNDVGGIVGFNHTASVINCINYGNVEGSVQGAGGIVGGSSSLKGIINCYNSGNITGNKNVGGIIGDAGWTTQDPSPIENCYIAGNITGNTYVGGIVGIKGGYGTHSIINCYWPQELNLECGTKTGTGVLNITDSVAKLKAEMKTAEFFELLNEYVNTYNTANANNTDFVKLNNWVFDSQTGYPILDME